MFPHPHESRKGRRRTRHPPPFWRQGSPSAYADSKTYARELARASRSFIEQFSSPRGFATWRLWKSKEYEPLILVPGGFRAWLGGNSPDGTIRWDRLKASEELEAAIQSKGKEALLHEFEICRFLFDRAYREARCRRYEAAARLYAMAGCGRISLQTLGRWGVKRFKDNLALDLYERESQRGIMHVNEPEITARLPAHASCYYCGATLAKPQYMAQVRCNQCECFQIYANKERDRILARMVRSRFKKELAREKETYKKPSAYYNAEFVDAGVWAPQVHTLMSLIRSYL